MGLVESPVLNIVDSRNLRSSEIAGPVEKKRYVSNFPAAPGGNREPSSSSQDVRETHVYNERDRV